MELFTAYTSLEKATQLYQSTNMDLERNFEKLITGVNENFTRKNNQPAGIYSTIMTAIKKPVSNYTR